MNRIFFTLIAIGLSIACSGCMIALEYMGDPLGTSNATRIEKENAAEEKGRNHFKEQRDAWLGRSIDDYVMNRGSNPNSSYNMTTGGTQYVFEYKWERGEFWGDTTTITCRETFITNKGGIIQSWKTGGGCGYSMENSRETLNSRETPNRQETPEVVGIPRCDQYISEYRACMTKKHPNDADLHTRYLFEILVTVRGGGEVTDKDLSAYCGSEIRLMAKEGCTHQK